MTFFVYTNQYILKNSRIPILNGLTCRKYVLDNKFRVPIVSVIQYTSKNCLHSNKLLLFFLSATIGNVLFSFYSFRKQSGFLSKHLRNLTFCEGFVKTQHENDSNISEAFRTKSTGNNYAFSEINDQRDEKINKADGTHTDDSSFLNPNLKSSKSKTQDCFAEWNDFQSELQVFSGSSNPELAREVCSHLGIPLGRVKIGRFSDGEVILELLDEVRGHDVFVIQSSPCASTIKSPHASLMELFFLISAAKRASAKHVTAILPYASYFRQPMETETSCPLAGADLGRILLAMGVDRVIFVDVHTQRIEGLFPDPIPITNVLPYSLAIEHYRRKKDLNRNIVVVSPDNIGTERAESFLARFNQAGFNASMTTIVNSRTERPQHEQAVITVVSQTDNPNNYIEDRKTKEHLLPQINYRVTDWLAKDVTGKDCIIVDDIIDTGERAVNTAHALKAAGARNIFMFATHGLFSQGAVKNIIKSPIKEVVITDTIRLPESLYCEKLRVISVSKLLAEGIRRVHCKVPLSDLYRDEQFDIAMEEGCYKQ